MNAPDQGSKIRPSEGDILDWEFRDEHGEPVMRDLTRDEARELKREVGGLVCKVVVAH